jgi:hypothetical protein
MQIGVKSTAIAAFYAPAFCEEASVDLFQLRKPMYKTNLKRINQDATHDASTPHSPPG